MSEQKKTFWLSFCDGDRPKGRQFLGVAVVDVSAEEAADMLLEVMLRFPNAQDGAEWVGAAARKAHRLGCNPGGEVGSVEMPPEWPGYETCPRGELLSRERLIELGLI